MTLTEWIEKQGSGAKRALSESTGLRWATVHDIACGRSTPRPDTALKIEAATNGEVSAAELLLGAEHAEISTRDVTDA